MSSNNNNNDDSGGTHAVPLGERSPDPALAMAVTSSSSLFLLLPHPTTRCTSIKIDPYLNIDAGTMSPFEHGEVFVLDDGGEVDLDLGNYERFIGITLTRDHNITTGKIFQSVIEKEREVSARNARRG